MTDDDFDGDVEATETYRDAWLAAERAVVDERERRRKAEDERDDLRAKVEQLRSIANVNGDWSLKFMRVEQERDELKAKVERREDLLRDASVRLSRAEALVEEWMRHPDRPCNHGASASELNVALRGPRG